MSNHCSSPPKSGNLLLLSTADPIASLQLTQSEIDELRGSDLAADTTVGSLLSDVSHPDFSDARQDLYNIVYGISPESDVDDTLSDKRMTDAERDRRFEQVCKDRPVIVLKMDLVFVLKTDFVIVLKWTLWLYAYLEH